MRRLTAPLALLALAALVACPKSTTSFVATPDDGSSEVPAGSVDPGPDPAADGTTPSEGTTSADGGTTPGATTCLSDADCNGGVCEGQGCGDTEPGTCASTSRMCTRDSRPYCGCDGQTFRASGTCPGKRYEREGECGTP